MGDGASRGLEEELPMTLRWSYIERNRETEILAERLSRKIHAAALVLTAIVLVMRLVTGRQDLTSDAERWDTSTDPVAGGPSSSAQ